MAGQKLKKYVSSKPDYFAEGQAKRDALLPPEEALARGKAREDKSWRARVCRASTGDPGAFADPACYAPLRITSKSELGYVPYSTNAPQRRLDEIVLENRRREQKSLICVFKPRQRAGVSTWCMRKAMTEWATFPFKFNAKVAAIQDETLSDLWEMYRVARDCFLGNFDRDVEDSEDEAPKKRGRANDNFIEHPKTRSRVMIQNAGQNLGRGGAALDCYLSEAEYYPNFWDSYKSVMPGLSDHWLSTRVIESTMKRGTSTEYKDFVRAAIEGKGYGDDKWAAKWTPVFIAWFECDNACAELSPEDEAKFLAEMDSEEEALQRRYKLSAGHLVWRRRMIAEQFAGNRAAFVEAYPSCIEEALEAGLSGQFFVAESLRFHEKHLRPPRARLVVDYARDSMRSLLEGEAANHAEIWSVPRAGYTYIIGVDPVDTSSTASALGSESYCVVVDAATGEICATWHARCSAYEAASAAAALGRYYNWAEIVHEDNKGGGFLAHLQSFSYPRIYERENLLNPSAGTQVGVYGFRTDARTRPILVGVVQQVINEKRTALPCATLFRQCVEFGKRGGAPQKHQAREGEIGDDGVIALALAATVHRNWERWPARVLELVQRSGPNIRIERVNMTRARYTFSDFDSEDAKRRNRRAYRSLGRT